MGHVLMSNKIPNLTVPHTGILLGDIAEGSIVKLNESGSPVEFYVAKHDYESALNGVGRTLLVRKNCYDSRVWHSINKNLYASSDIDAWLNGDYKVLLDSDVQTAVGTTKFYYTPTYTSSVTDLERSVFLLSITEFGISYSYANIEGSALPIASNLKIAYFNESAVSQWTRSLRNSSDGFADIVTSTGSAFDSRPLTANYSRPCFTMPSGALFDDETMLFNGKVVA